MENGKAALAEGLMNGLGFGSTELHVLRPGRVILPKYLLYFVRQQSFRNAAKQRMQGAVGQQRVPEDFLRTFPIPLPPLSEQQRIVETLDQADDLRKKRAKADAKADRILDCLFIRMFGDPEMNPMGWEKAKISNLAVELRYGTSIRCTSEPTGLPVLRIPNILHNEIDLSDLKYGELPEHEVDRLSLPRGDILLVRTNGNRDYVGCCAVFDLKTRYLFASYLIRLRLDQKQVDPWFVGAYLRTFFGRQAMSPFIRTTAGQSNIGLEGLRQISIPLPPITMQRHFRNHTERLYGLHQERDLSRARLDVMLNNLLHRAFSGDLTTVWRNAHMKEFLAEMEEQAKYLIAHGTRNQLQNEALQDSLL